MINRITIILFSIQFFVMASCAQEHVANTNSISSFEESIVQMKKGLSDIKAMELDAAIDVIDGTHLTILDANKLEIDIEDFPEGFRKSIKKEMNGMTAEQIISRGDSLSGIIRANVSRGLSATLEVNKELEEIANAALGYYMKPSMLGGGSQSYSDFNFNKPEDNWFDSISEDGNRAITSDAVYVIEAKSPDLVITAHHIAMMRGEPGYESKSFNSSTVLVKPDKLVWLDKE